MNFDLSTYGHAAQTPSPVNRLMAQFATDFRDGVDVNLGVGYINEETIPDRRMVEALEAIAANPRHYRQAFNYGSPRGAANLIEALRDFHAGYGIGRLDRATLDRNELIVGVSGATSLLDAFTDVLKRGLVVTADPMYYIYCNALERKGFEVLAVPEDNDGADPEAVADRVAALGDRLFLFRHGKQPDVHHPVQHTAPRLGGTRGAVFPRTGPEGSHRFRRRIRTPPS